MVRGAAVQPSPKLADFAEGTGRASNYRNVYRFPDHRFLDGDADATLLVALSPCGVRDFQQLVDERVLVLDFGEFGYQVDYSSARRCKRAPETYPVLSRSDLRRIYRWQYMESHRYYNKSTDVSVSVLVPTQICAKMKIVPEKLAISRFFQKNT